ncbi:MAG: hypothetical protein KIT11_00830 [Fimbriimonadaceae bacterium]|nr:hypothetical protein [Fimbriimonadaceae bacterium]QYK55082.1 MAG: hypothetical protein KF733_08705 [Fimbriimonadaceae bacterium]
MLEAALLTWVLTVDQVPFSVQVTGNDTVVPNNGSNLIYGGGYDHTSQRVHSILGSPTENPPTWASYLDEWDFVETVYSDPASIPTYDLLPGWQLVVRARWKKEMAWQVWENGNAIVSRNLVNYSGAHITHFKEYFWPND